MDKMIKKATAFEIVNHWALAVSFFVLAITGFGFLFHLEQLNSIILNVPGFARLARYM